MTPSITAEQMDRLNREVNNGSVLNWNPKFRGTDLQRSQALALVEWLADRIHKRIDGQDNYFRQLLSAIHWRNIEALEQLALELIGEGNG